MLLSVVIPAYRFDEYIIECVNSVLSQRTNFNFEILIRDDHSGDNTNRILRENFSSHPKVKILESDRNLGAYGNIKLLLEKAVGKYITILDGDDYLSNDQKLQMQVDFLEANPEYVMHSTGYISLLPDGSIDPPEPGHNRFPKQNEVITEDLLESNIVSFGRMFRNIPGSVKSWMETFPYLDWAFNYEMSLHGKIRCDDWNCGVYRHNSQGMFSLKSEEDKLENNKAGIEIIKKRELLRKSKTISIVDCFVHDKKVEANLKKCIERLKNNGHDIFLISNTPLERTLIEMVDYHFYDRRNQLFKKEYPGVIDVDFWTNQGSFTVHNMKSGLQKHGLSVMINLFNALDICKNIGYTHFQRFETDDLYGPDSMDWISKIPETVITDDKNGLFYLNEYNNPPDASFHYFFCEIEKFISIMPRISCEEDYEKYLIDIQGNRNFRIVETYIYDNIKKSSDGSLLIRDGGDQMISDFPDTSWNTVVSASNLPSKYKGCLTDLYQIKDSLGNSNGYCLYSQNYLDQEILRRIVIYNENSESFEIHHKLEGRNSWWLNNLTGVPLRIEVYQGGELIYSQTREENSGSYIQSNPE
jgi:glycosyltransferase involved in cell wall biosynthesis